MHARMRADRHLHTLTDGHWTEIAEDYGKGQHRCAKCHSNTHPQKRGSSAVSPGNTFTVICGLSKDEAIKGTQDQSTNHSCHSQGVNWQFRLGLLKLLYVDAVIGGRLPLSSGNMRLKLMKAEQCHPHRYPWPPSRRQRQHRPNADQANGQEEACGWN